MIYEMVSNEVAHAARCVGGWELVWYAGGLELGHEWIRTGSRVCV